MKKHFSSIIALGSIALYMLGFVLTWSFEGDIAGLWTILPAVTIGWLLGIPAALVFGLFSIPANLLLFDLVSSPTANLRGYHLVGGIAYAVIGMATGWVKGVIDQSRAQAHLLEHERENLQAEITKREHAEEALKQAKTNLEMTVMERTLQLQQANVQLQIKLTEHKAAEDKSRQYIAQLESVRQIGLEITAELDLNTLLRSTAERVNKMMGGRTSSIWLHRPERDILERVIYLGPYLVNSAPTRKRGEGLIGKVWASGKPMIVNDYGHWDNRNTAYDNAPSRNVLAVPLQWGDQILGVANIVADPPRAFTEADVELMNLFAMQASIAIHNAQLFQSAQQDIAERKRAEEQMLRKNKELTTLNQIGKALNKLATPAEILGLIDEMIGQVFDNRNLYIALYDSANQYVTFPVYRMDGEVSASVAGRPFNNGLTEFVLRSKAPLLINSQMDEKLTEYGIGLIGRVAYCYLAVPMLINERAIGVIAVQDYEKEYVYNSGDIELLSTIASQAAVALENARLFAEVQQELAEREKAEEQLIHNALHDPLTDLPNRVLFMDRLSHALERAHRRDDCVFAVLYLDLDRFKVVNDSLGHDVGDKLLIESARRLSSCLRTLDTVARLGGDEFAILLEDIQGMSEVTHVADRIQHDLAQPFDLDQHKVFISVSIGVVLKTDEYDRPEDFLRDADTAMYRAKAFGRGRYVVFDHAMRDRAMTRMEMETDLRLALERKEFFIHYQPIVSLRTTRIVGFEALVRWQHSTRGLLSPAEFIPVAEETGLIVPIDQWVLFEACRQMREWQTQFPGDPPLTISVNLSAKQFGQPDLVEKTARVLRETGLDASSLKLELTESTIIEDSEAVSALLLELRALGVQVQIDDFGTGYSSLGYLHRLPIDTLKIDRTFIGKIGVNGNGSDIVRTILLLAHDLGMKVIAEGVETPEQLAKLLGFNCEYGQGFLFAKPVDRNAATALIAGLACPSNIATT